MISDLLSITSSILIFSKLPIVSEEKMKLKGNTKLTKKNLLSYSFFNLKGHPTSTFEIEPPSTFMESQIRFNNR